MININPKKINYTIIVILGLITFVSSCYYDSKEELYPYLNTNCDTTNISFSNSVIPVLQINCLGCHSNSAAVESGGGIFLEDYSNVKALGENGILMGSVNQLDGYKPMPENTGKIDDCSILILNMWIEQGYPQ